jgi:Putative zinc- or iron-chelating domain
MKGDALEMNPDRSNGKGGPAEQVLTPEQRSELERGLRFAHVMLNVNLEQGNEAIAFVQALADVLVKKGILTAEELEEPIERARKEVAEVEMPRVRLGEIGDKYAEGESAEVYCARRIPLCQGRCCSFEFFLTKQDLDEGVARWDYGNPYWILHDEQGLCVHADPVSHFCTIHARRPHICRKYSCKDDKRIWLDFENMVLAPPTERTTNAPIALAEVALRKSLRISEEVASEGAKDAAASREMEIKG